MGKFFGNRWWVVVASVCGLLLGTGAINTFAFAVFLKPLTEDLGISRGVLGSTAGLEFLATTIGTAILGWLITRWGTRRVMIPGALTTALQSTLQLAAFLIAHFGWRIGYLGLGLAIVVIAGLPVALLLREPPRCVQDLALPDPLPHLPAARGMSLSRAGAGLSDDERQRQRAPRARNRRRPRPLGSAKYACAADVRYGISMLFLLFDFVNRTAASLAHAAYNM